jgi:superfamily I DNA/RNA helicase
LGRNRAFDELKRCLETAKIPWNEPNRSERFEQRPHIVRLLALLECLNGDVSGEFVEDFLHTLDPVPSGSVIRQLASSLMPGRTYRSVAESAAAYLDGPRTREAERLANLLDRAAKLGILDFGPEALRRLWGDVLRPLMNFRERQHATDIEADIELLAMLAADFASPDAFVNSVRTGAVSDDATSDPTVTIGTIHYSKGREWDAIFLVNLTEGHLPEARAGDVREEQRIFYTGATRAKKQLYLCSPKRIAGASGHSRFIHSVEVALKQWDVQ